ncbi:hypothetical protein [Actinoplanes couchii]|uniref:Secreted protein n=1 Tax=Actinoplanes couchii TaxID=403638 RepID=A0ABQ3X0M1_9ACTN|nr:hypothetical protein [Actinoplanes couchii]MDR6316470.1 hypothetical protein [Actinoplanes couchii]GID52085.1 hypothetical protein Aco03nite_004890 [Actinoplanes couchii]
MTSSSDWTEVVGAVGMFALLITVIIVAAALLGARGRSRARQRRDSEYRELAERLVAGQESIAQQLVSANDQLAGLRTRIDRIETVLKQVE